VKGLPPGWASTSFAELGQLRLGKMLDKSKNTGVPVSYLRNVNVRWFQFDLSDLQTILLSEDEKDALSIQDGDLLICEGGEPGRAAVWRGGANDLTFQKALHRMRVASGIEPELLMYRLRADAESGRLSDAFTGTTIKHLTGESLARYRTSIPPEKEQRRLVKAISAVLARVDLCGRRLDRVAQILKKFREAVLEAAVSGRLTEEWRIKTGAPVQYTLPNSLTRYGETRLHALPEGWYWARFADVASIDSRLVDPSQYPDSPHIAPNHIESWTGRLLPHGTVASDGVTSGKQQFHAGQVLYSKIRPYLAKAVMVDFDGLCSADMYPLSGKAVSSRFLHRWLLTRTFTDFASANESRTVLPKINQLALSEIPVPVPPMLEQNEIVRRVEELFQLGEAIQLRYDKTLRSVEKLTPAVLAMGFRGELVPQDPNEEPAGVMLERLRAGRGNDGAEAAERSGRRSNGAKLGGRELRADGAHAPRRRGRPGSVRRI
jgi:type I restriction enzyme S subunit